jgi:hypothetical protein
VASSGVHLIILHCYLGFIVPLLSFQVLFIIMQWG